MAHFLAETLDDAMRELTEALLSRGKPIVNTKGPSVELFGILLEIENPRARLSRTETRGKSFSCLGELCWYLSKTNSLEFITHYLSQYSQYADDGLLNGAYGPRLFDWSGVNQVQNVAKLLKSRPNSRQAVIQLFSASDLLKDYKDVPCTCYLQFAIRENKLALMTTMRSNDVYKGLPHDVFSFTMLQEILARMLEIEIGVYKHAVGSIHLYDDDQANARQFLEEGWQSTETPMPPMPPGDPWQSIGQLLKIELQVRLEGQADERELENMKPYWADLARMLQIFSYSKERNLVEIERVRKSISSTTYLTFVDRLKSQLK